MSSHHQRGFSGTFVIITILFLALMATLGVVFYQNFVQKKPATQSQTTQTTPQTAQLQTARVAFNSAIYAVDYPAGWTVVPKTDTSSSTLTITNAPGTIQVNVGISKNPVTVTCDPSTGQLIHDYSVDSNHPVKNLTSTPVFLVEAIYDAVGGGYQYTIGLVPDGGDTHSATDNPNCDVSHTGIAANVLLNGQTIVHPTITATITFPKLPSAPKAAAPDMQTLKNLIAGNDYTVATTIIQSLRKE